MHMANLAIYPNPMHIFGLWEETEVPEVVCVIG